jgi:hypothetical protein
MVVKLNSEQSQLAMWLPFEFFLEAGLVEGGKSRAQVENDLAFLKPYHAIFVQSSLDQADGSSLYATEKEVLGRASLMLEDGTELKPLDKIPPLVSATLAAMKAIIRAEGDAGSANLHILLFPSANNNKPVIDAGKKGKLTLVMKGDKRFRQEVFNWYTPFDAINHGLVCQRCKESISVKWSYCPWCGAAIERKR